MPNRKVGRRNGAAKQHRNPVSKSDLIRRLHNKGKDTGEIRTALEKQGYNVHYSEIYGAIEREPVA
jgi:hypothetical protein